MTPYADVSIHATASWLQYIKAPYPHAFCIHSLAISSLNYLFLGPKFSRIRHHCKENIDKKDSKRECGKYQLRIGKIEKERMIEMKHRIASYSLGF